MMEIRATTSLGGSSPDPLQAFGGTAEVEPFPRTTVLVFVRRWLANAERAGLAESGHPHYLFSSPVSRKVMVPQNKRARIWTGK
jgi:hypothetical protein